MRSLSEIWPRAAHTTKPNRTAFVLSGGAAMGALQVGMLRALVERRILPDVIYGCSVGAINGAVLAGGANLATVGRIQDIWIDLIDRELVPTGLLPSPVQLVRKGESISSSDGLRDLLAEILPADHFDELDVPFECVATDIDDAAEHWFTSGSILPAVLASASIPAVFPAVEVDGRRYLDGGIVDDVPVQRAVEEGATRIFVLQVGGVDRPRPETKRPLDVAMLAYWIARRHRLLEDLARIPDDVEVVILPHGDPQPVRFTDLSSSAHLMDVAYRASSGYLDARIDGRIGPTFGPQHDRGLGSSPEMARSDETTELETAHRLLASARSMIGFGGDGATAERGAVGQEDRRRLVERAEAIGPAMRGLVDRILERGVRAGETDGSRAHPDDDQPAEK
ncbi:MAG: patatin-like phospholipase family protein [Actinobacteria bacterium]|nr:patatin-like phospholipase family protein [Actinomycetota bacterium]